MSNKKLKQVIPEILKNINFRKYLLHSGYTYLPKKNIGSFKCYKSESVKESKELLFVSTHQANEIYYSVPNADQGSIVDFVKNRLHKKTENSTFNPSIDTLIQACRTLISYIDKHGVDTEKEKEMKSLDEIKQLKKILFTRYFGLNSTLTANYFEDINISENTYNHPIFENKIFSKKGINLEGTIYQDAYNIAFPLDSFNGDQKGIYYNCSIVIDNKKQNKHFFSEYSQKNGVWKTNDIKLKTNERRHLTIVTEPIQAAAHFELFDRKSFIQYFVLFKIDSTSLNHLYSEIKKQSSILYFSSNINIENIVKDLTILSYLINFQYDMHVENIDNSNISIRMLADLKDSKLYKPFVKRIFSYNKTHVMETSDILGSSSTQHLKNDLLNIKEVDSYKGKTFIITVPHSVKAIYNFLKIITDSFPLLFNICIEKPKHITWLNQNRLNDKTKSLKSIKDTNELVAEELVYTHKTR